MKRFATAIVTAALVVSVAPGASATEAAPPCEVMLPPDVCEQFFYAPLALVGGTTYWATNYAYDTAFDVAQAAVDKYEFVRCQVPGMCP